MPTQTTNIFEEGLLKYLSEEQLAKIQSVKIGIGGAGGLGSNVAMILVRSGFNNIEILDHDNIDPSNLNRQQYYAQEIGEPKFEVLMGRLQKINPDLHLIAHREKWEPENGKYYFKDCDFIVEAFDDADWKYKFVDYYQDKCHTLISGVGMAGLIQKEPMSVKKLGNVYFVGDRTTDTACGHPPMAPRVTACAAMMAEIILDLTLEVPVRV